MLAIISLLKLARLFERLRYSLLTAIYDRMTGEVERFKGRALFRLNGSMGTNRTALHDLLLEGMLGGAMGREKFGTRVGEFVERMFKREMEEG
jgi:hypothetical protein